MTWLLGMVEALIYERGSRYHAVSRSIGELWGKPQTITGLVLAVPYGSRSAEPGDGWTRHAGVAYFLPQKLDIDARLEPETRHRGIFETVVYKLDMTLSGRFAPPRIAPWLPRPEVSKIA